MQSLSAMSDILRKISSTIICVFIDSVCDTMPCQNGGTCNVVAGAVSCSCVPGYSGYTCQGKHNQFEKHYWFTDRRHIQTYRLGLNVLFCVKYQTFNLITFCVFIDSVCDTMPCQNGGTCSVSAAGTFQCACVPGYSGSTCQGWLCVFCFPYRLNKAPINYWCMHV